MSYSTWTLAVRRHLCCKREDKWHTYLIIRSNHNKDVRQMCRQEPNFVQKKEFYSIVFVNCVHQNIVEKDDDAAEYRAILICVWLGDQVSALSVRNFWMNETTRCPSSQRGWTSQILRHLVARQPLVHLLLLSFYSFLDFLGNSIHMNRVWPN
jgi:hypothetical protein